MCTYGGICRSSCNLSPDMSSTKSFTIVSAWVRLSFSFSPNHASKPAHARRMSASYISLCSLIARLYFRPSNTPAIKPSAITPDYTATSLNPASPKRFPIIASIVHIVWKTPIRRTMGLNVCWCFHATSDTLA